MLDFTRYQILTFDCYGTLIDWETGILSALHRIFSAHAKNIDDAAILKLYGDFEQSAEQDAYQPYRDVLASVVRQFGAELGFTPTPAEVRSLADSLPQWKSWPDTVAALQKLKQRFRLRHPLQHRRRSIRRNPPATRRRFRRHHHSRAGPSLQAVAEAFRTRTPSHPGASPSRPARRPEHLSRCDPRPIPRSRHGLGQPTVRPPRRRRSQSRRSQTRPDRVKLGRTRRRTGRMREEKRKAGDESDLINRF